MVPFRRDCMRMNDEDSIVIFYKESYTGKVTNLYRRVKWLYQDKSAFAFDNDPSGEKTPAFMKPHEAHQHLQSALGLLPSKRIGNNPKQKFLESQLSKTPGTRRTIELTKKLSSSIATTSSSLKTKDIKKLFKDELFGGYTRIDFLGDWPLDTEEGYAAWARD